jgi:hypothetical protein
MKREGAYAYLRIRRRTLWTSPWFSALIRALPEAPRNSPVPPTMAKTFYC